MLPAIPPASEDGIVDLVLLNAVTRSRSLLGASERRSVSAPQVAAAAVPGWGWQGFSAFLDMLEIQVDRGTGWGPLAFDTTPNYTDTAPFPATPARWKYRAIYRLNDAQVGVWSAEASITVGG